MRDIFLARINTGCRGSEIANLSADGIRLDHNIPHIAIAGEDREVKTGRAEREIPLVGVSLEAMRRHPDGFPRYRGKDAFSAGANKFLRDNGLMETDAHTVYSLRHRFQDCLTQTNAPERVDRDLMGHRLSREEYGEGASFDQKLNVLRAFAL